MCRGAKIFFAGCQGVKKGFSTKNAFFAFDFVMLEKERERKDEKRKMTLSKNRE